PPLFMAALLTTRPRQGLGLRRPPGGAWPASALLALLGLPPLAGVAGVVPGALPGAGAGVGEGHPVANARAPPCVAPARPRAARLWVGVVVVRGGGGGVAFGGFFLGGRRGGSRRGGGVAGGAFLFALYHMTVFHFFPPFLLGLALGLLVVRSGSVLPAVVF